MAESFYVPAGEDAWLATPHTTGPWDARAQHGGPPSALLGRAIQRCGPRDDMVIARFTCEILRPIPVGEIQVQARLARPGRSVELLEAVASAGGVSPGSGGGGSDRAGTGGLSVRSTRQALARATSRPPPLATASRNSTLRPGRARLACTRISPIGIGRRISQVKRAMIMSSRGAQRWIARPRSALGGPPCWARASHGPVVWGVASQVSSPAGT